LVTGPGGRSSSKSNSALGFSLASLPSVSDEQLETLGDDDLCHLISKFRCVYHNRQRKKNPGCYNCGDLNHFIADCPQEVRRWAEQLLRLLPPPQPRRGSLQQGASAPQAPQS